MNETLSKEEFSNLILKVQRDEINGFKIYSKLAKIEKDASNREILSRIAAEEYSHYNFFKSISGREVGHNRLTTWFYFTLTHLFGLTFGIKLMERQEDKAQRVYPQLLPYIPEIDGILRAEEEHESELIEMIKEEKLDYAGSIVLGLNDALVELTGALAGFSFAMQNTRLIAIAGLITGIAASLSMAASQYISVSTENSGQNALKSSIYTGIAYVITVIILIAPYLILQSYFAALALTLTFAILIILVFNYYISVAKDLNFKRRFSEMAIISLGVAALTFGIGFLIRKYLGVDI
ncbi:MAG TPA: VIT1/CCC1 transporter family protein [Tenuifilaceae bacterium]|jgi:VIT1/CCC1 family predicted Fe2+/Mn2+ transporter|nr:VIT1/CCC1 transporter family protein [Bacteroidales bacterium]HNT42063.1 VIT1/CCC1 transporter family protein [Tenuifilaceae bacterium]MBP8642772.1 VIT1/CCC1 transporter family protein [Bacteroidales bacterium]NLI88044.1 rubrerythrin family protein [Bacteroidales bacterium]HNY09279.1 VIT1/CCC1 transporter family protein [Tenuifilaceae bacterium]